MMKKYLILLIMAVAVFVSCGQENLLREDETVQVTPITFNLTANHPDATKAVKTGWEAGDAIFVFFNKVAAPKFLKMTYNGTGWTCAEMNGGLGLKNGDSGMMRAVFLPFGSDATVSADGESFVFNETYYTYYLTATLDYTVSNGKVSGAFQMEIPDDYVQFFVEDADAQDEAYQLGCDAVIPTGVASISANGTITETSDKTAADDMLGYAYGSGDNKGYLFSGKLTTWKYGSNYYFAKTKTADGSRADYFVTGKTLTSHSAVKLPANDNVYATQKDGLPNDGKWIPVGSGITVQLGKFYGEGILEEFASYGTWHTCNYNCTKPEEIGDLLTFDQANSIEGITLPTKGQFAMIRNYCSMTTMSIHGGIGKVANANLGFIFLPLWYMNYKLGAHWTSTPLDNEQAYYFEPYEYDEPIVAGGRTVARAVRPIAN